MKAGVAAATAEVDLGRSAARRRIHFGIKLALGLALIAWLVVKGGPQKIIACFSQASAGWLLLALGIYLAGQSLCAWKWGILAGSLSFRRPMRFYWVNYLGAMFPSLFLPTSVGGDVFRVVALAHGGGDKVAATVSVLADRGTGVLAMSWIAALTCLFMPGMRLPVMAAESIYALSAALTVGFLLPFFWRPAFARKGLLARALACWDRPGALVLSVGAAFLFQGLVCVIYVLLGAALRLQVPAGYYFLFCPVVSLVSMAPVTVNGTGVREATLVALFPIAGIAGEQAAAYGVAFGLAWSALVMLASLIGAAVLFVDDRQAGWSPKSRAPEATPQDGD